MALHWPISVDSVLGWLQDTFRKGILSMPGYKLGDQVSMMVDTKQDLDDLPTTETEGEEG